MLKLDEWILHNVERFVLWLEEWLSISQFAFERTLIAIVAIADFWELLDIIYFHPVPYQPKWLAEIAWFGMLFYMWRCHSLPLTSRQMLRDKDLWMRITTSLLIPLDIFLNLYRMFYRHDFVYTRLILSIDVLGLWLFLYTLISHIDGHPGRKRKLALAELRRLFGDWIPIPAE